MTDRRTFLATAAAAALASCDRKREPDIAPPIIDTHTHFYDPTRKEGVPWPPKTEALLYKTHLPADFTALAAPLGVTGTVVVEASGWLEDNQWVLDLAAREPVILGVVGNLKPGVPEFKDNWARFAANELFVGIRIQGKALIAGVENAAYVADLRRIVESGRQIDVVGNSEYLPAVERLAAQLPDLRIVIDHLPMEVKEAQRAVYSAALAALAPHKNVFAKVSFILRKIDGKVSTALDIYRASVDEVWNVFGPDRVIYGSNWPVSNLWAPYETVFRVADQYFSEKGPAARNKYFYLNAKKAYRWPNRHKRCE